MTTDLLQIEKRSFCFFSMEEDTTETQLRDVPCVADDALKEELGDEADKDQNFSETPLLLGQAANAVVGHSEKKKKKKMQFSSPETGDGSVKKRKTWLLNDSEVTDCNLRIELNITVL